MTMPASAELLGDEPLVSVVLPVFNGGAFLKPAVRSILLQSHRNLELIVIDDGSTDGSLELLAQFARADERVRLVSRENRGLIATLNEGLSLASGDLIARMDADDIAYPERLAVQVASFAADPALALCGCRYDALFAGERLGHVVGYQSTSPEELRVLSLFFTMLLHPTVMFRRSVIDGQALRYDASYPHAEDFDLFRRLAARYPARLVGPSLVAYRFHGESVSATRKRQMRTTHLRIVAENLRLAHGYELPSEVGDLLDGPAPISVRKAAASVRELDALADQQPEALRRAYGEGIQNLFFFLYTIIWETGDAAALREYVRLSSRWGCIRRRERWLLDAGPAARAGGAALLRVLRGVESAHRWVASRPARRAVPNWEALHA
jgi:glycosyltransferase involved in cell wall biosynthesis